MAAALEEILGRLLVPDNAVIQEATQQLKTLFKDPGVVPTLCQVLSTSQTPQVRQYAAILLRRKVQKLKQWKNVSPDIANSIRENILQLMLQEPERGVGKAIAQVVATIAKHDLPTNQWPQLFTFITNHTKSENPAHREVGMFVLYTVSSVAAEQLKPHLLAIIQLVSLALQDQQSFMVTFYAVKTLNEVLYFIGDEEKRAVQTLVPQVLQVIRQLMTQEEEKACEAFEVLDEMLECEVGIIVPHVKSTVQFCLEVAAKSDLEDSVRVKAMSYIMSLTKLKKKQILKHQLVDPILNVLFPVICAQEEEDTEEEVEDLESQAPAPFAAQVIDIMAMHLPPDKIIPNVMRLVEPCLTDERPGHRRGAYTAMAVVAEGCADYITNRYLKVVLECVCKGLNDPHPGVRNGALFALGQFSEHLQPDISKYAAEILPLLFQYLVTASQEAEKNPMGVTKSYYALETFCQNLDKDIMPYLPGLMEHLMTVLKTASSLRAKELAISAIGATACAAEEGMQPYFQAIIEHFRVFLASGDNEEMLKLQVQAIDTLGVLARSVGAAAFMPLAKESIQFGVNLLNTAEDPDQRRCIYGLFAAISSLLKADMKEYLPTIMHYMLLSLRTTEGVKAHLREDKEKVTIFDEEEFEDEVDLEADEQEDEAEENNKIEGISVENAFVDEKEDTCVALGEIAVNVGQDFIPYLEESYEEILQLVDYPAERVKKGALKAVGQYCCCVHQVYTATQAPQTLTALQNMLKTVVPKLLTIIKDDLDRVVVMTTVDVLHDMLEKIGQPVLEVTGATEDILSSMKNIFTHKVSCQDEEEEGEDQEAEYDSMLIESAGDVIPVMAKLMGGTNFLPFFASFLTDLVKRLKHTSSVSEKSFAVGTLGETVEACGPAISAFADTLYPLFMKMIEDEDEEVRSNSVYSLGVLIKNSELQQHFPQILKTFADLLKKETDGCVRDNVCAAICRLIMTNNNSIPLHEVVPGVMSCLPLKEDMEEYLTVFKCLLQLYEAGDTEVVKCVPLLLKVVSDVLGGKDIKSETEGVMVQFVQSVSHKQPQDFVAIRGSLPAENASKLSTCVNMSNGTS